LELTEKERLLLIKKKEEICKLTNEILEIEHDPEQITEIKKKMTTVLSLISTIASYSESRNIDLQAFLKFAHLLFIEMRIHKRNNTWEMITRNIETFCNFANFIRFNFTKRGIKIVIPKIDLSIFKL